jgi:hypothetical protein
MASGNLKPFGSKFCPQYQTDAKFFLVASDSPGGGRHLFVHYEEGGFEDRAHFWTEVPSDWSDRDLQELIDWPTIGSHYPSWEVPARAFGRSELFRWWKGEIPE